MSIRCYRIWLLIIGQVVISTSWFLLAALAQENEPQAGRRYALLVGVRNYKKDQLKSLKYTENDVNDLAQVLKDAGYKRVVLLTQKEGDKNVDLLPTGANIRDQLKGLLEHRKPEDSILLAFSGHGVQFKDDPECYFCPMDATLKDKKSLVSLTEIYKELEKCGAGSKLLISDACRNDPQSDLAKDTGGPKVESVTRPQMQKPPGGVAALFSCSEGQRSFESDELKHGIFFHYLIEGMKGKAPNKKGEVTLQSLIVYVNDEVPDRVKEDIGPRENQVPHLVGDLRGSVPLISRVLGLSAEITNTIGMKLVRIKPGRFQMGSPKDEEGRFDSEGPQHAVEITRPFYMGRFTVTVGQFRAFVKAAEYETEAVADGQGGWGYNAATRKYEGRKKEYSWREVGWKQTDEHPVVNVTWNDAVKFCEWLSRKEKKTYALPTEAEWEYACRAGTGTRYSSGDAEASLKKVANITDASLKAKLDADFAKTWVFQSWDDGHPFTAPVGSFQPNAWGLYDMHGNVFQWCADWYGETYYADSPIKDPKSPESGKYRVLRGGSWADDARHCRSAHRVGVGPAFRGNGVGFRVVLRGP
jgi:formylglycine-generating enzyme required for sulfatase activity